jgi:pantoate--beta-alanine ligase
MAAMEIVETKVELRAALRALRAEGAHLGLVPTMGYLHAGHLSLFTRSVAENDATVGTVFVNPLQFAPTEDLASYPRDLDGDTTKARDAGVDVLFVPTTEEMYPSPVRTTVSVDVATGFMESAARPTHFDGVATVVAKLFGLVGECRAYFGEKDFQQLAVVRRMVEDLDLPVDVVGCPIVREPDGLAMSSRNAYLTDDERRVAPALHASLRAGQAAIAAGARSGDDVRAAMAGVVAAEPRFALDYAEVVDAATLERLDELVSGTEVRLVAAARLGTPRLLDNLGTTIP